MKNFTLFFLLLITIMGSKIKAQGADIVFLIDNSFSMTNNELDYAINSMKTIMQNAIECNPENRVAVAQYAYDLTRNNHSKVHINTDFTRNIATLQAIDKRRPFRGLGGSDDLEYAVRTITDALNGNPNEFIESSITTLNQQSNNNLVLFIFTDANRGSWDTKSYMVKTKRPGLILSEDTDAVDPLESYNNFKTPVAQGGMGGEIVMMNGRIYGAIGDISTEGQISYAVAISSVGGTYNASTPANNPFDPQGNQVLPRKYHSIPNNFWGQPETLSQADIIKLSAYICSVSNNITASADNYMATFTQGSNGVSSLGNILDNDNFNGAQPTLNDININILSEASPIAPGNEVPTIDVSNGQVVLPAGTSPGTYEITYQICDTAGIICDEALVTVVVGDLTVEAVDGAQAVNAGTTGTISVLENDIYNDGAPGSANLNNVNITQNNTTNPGVSLDASTGLISVDEGTPGGTYVITYTICDKVNANVCDQAIETITVDNGIQADNDNYTATAQEGIDGVGSLGNILDNDNYNGGSDGSATLTNSTITVLTPATEVLAGAPVPTINTSTGDVVLPTGTPSGVYSIVYELCDTSGPSCDNATVNITVDNLTLNASNGSQSVIPGTTGSISVLENDIYNGGNPGSATLSNVNINPISSSNPGVILDPNTGLITVAAGTEGGVYQVEYNICDIVNTNICSTAIETVIVPNSILADDDSFNISGQEGIDGVDNVGNILANDNYNGGADGSATPTNSTITVTSEATPVIAGASVPEIDVITGNVNVPAGTPSGIYEIEYQLCVNGGRPCDTATVTIVVDDISIEAVDGTQSVDTGSTGTISVLDNDIYNGGAAGSANLSNVTLTQDDTTNAGVNVNPSTGLITVDAGTPNGTYTITYTICDKINTSICSQATETITVQSSYIDISAGIQINPGVIDEGGTTNVTYNYSNIGTDATNGSNITYIIFKPANGILSIDTINETGWDLTESDTFFIITSNNNVEVGLSYRLSINATFVHDGSDENAVTQFETLIIDGSGGDVNPENNRDLDVLKIN